jgi:hypothetical protein
MQGRSGFLTLLSLGFVMQGRSGFLTLLSLGFVIQVYQEA